MNLCYNIASRAAQSTSYVSVIVHAESVNKSPLAKRFAHAAPEAICSRLKRFTPFAARAAIVSEGKILHFATIMDTNRDSAHQSQNEDNFPTFSLGLEFLNEAEKEKNKKEKNNGKGDGISNVTIRFTLRG